MSWDYAPLDINPVFPGLRDFPGLGDIIIDVIIIIIIIIISIIIIIVIIILMPWRGNMGMSNTEELVCLRSLYLLFLMIMKKKKPNKN